MKWVRSVEAFQLTPNCLYSRDIWNYSQNNWNLICLLCLKSSACGIFLNIYHTIHLKAGSKMVSAKRECIVGDWGLCPQWGTGAKPLVRGVMPPGADDIFTLRGQFKQWKLHPFYHYLWSQYCYNLCRNTNWNKCDDIDELVICNRLPPIIMLTAVKILYANLYCTNGGTIFCWLESTFCPPPF